MDLWIMASRIGISGEWRWPLLNPSIVFFFLHVLNVDSIWSALHGFFLPCEKVSLSLLGKIRIVHTEVAYLWAFLWVWACSTSAHLWYAVRRGYSSSKIGISLREERKNENTVYWLRAFETRIQLAFLIHELHESWVYSPEHHIHCLHLVWSYSHRWHARERSW